MNRFKHLQPWHRILCGGPKLAQRKSDAALHLNLIVRALRSGDQVSLERSCLHSGRADRIRQRHANVLVRVGQRLPQRGQNTLPGANRMGRQSPFDLGGNGRRACSRSSAILASSVSRPLRPPQ